jgi:hypothetical protein
MKRIYTLALVFLGILAVAGFNTSCGFSTPADPEHPLYVSYTISAGIVSFDGPDQLQIDIEAWIKSNSIVYDTQVSYSTGEASEFKKTDEEAIKQYNEVFLPKFKTYLNNLAAQLDKGTYGKVNTVKATIYTSASRLQGNGGSLKYEHHEFVYPYSSQH